MRHAGGESPSNPARSARPLSRATTADGPHQKEEPMMVESKPPVEKFASMWLRSYVAIFVIVVVFALVWWL